ncbi:hypothetical protein [Actinophytocola algeriensis]|uniref:Uncharacterized protein n=1 Tax=Actinophytocola algeriensis TaxID=1768010 RepID=A0A7W7Q103_9PSEU|nr:hypothetical protein [Actinophytocola algeriensis]MBB4904841.1 hypothetical protein [Actinophytocola algeriensis]MBE1476300.1 hypothetical protein [Actinophytocola algeriensis]
MPVRLNTTAVADSGTRLARFTETTPPDRVSSIRAGVTSARLRSPTRTGA